MKRIALYMMLGGTLFSQSCKKKDSDTATPAASDTQQMVENFSNIAFATYDDALIAAKNLKIAAQSFVDAPTADKFAELKTLYIAARYPYEQSETFRFSDGPIDNAAFGGIEGEINAWPLDEVYIDYTQDDAGATVKNTGIINDATTYPMINTQLLKDANGVDGEANVSTGYHAIEFLLWGQDFYADSPGRRQYTDYITSGPGATASNQARRGQYLLTCIDLLIADLQIVRDQWTPNQNNYRKTFVANPNQALLSILKGMGEFGKGELSGQRMSVALANNHDDNNNPVNSQEDEHSCFSDQTHNDIILGQRGIYNVYTGQYIRTDGSIIRGKSLDDLVASKDSKINSDMMAKIIITNTAVASIHPPFDQEISYLNTNGNARVLAAITALRAQSDQLIPLALKFNFDLLLNN